MGTKSKTDFLLASSSLISGGARLLDWAGQYDQYNASEAGAEADEMALFSDWAAVGDDLVDSMSEYEGPHAA